VEWPGDRRIEGEDVIANGRVAIRAIVKELLRG